MVFLTRFSAVFLLISQAFFSAAASSAISPTLLQRVKDAALHASLDPDLVLAVIKVESDFKTHAISPKGAMGLMQVMPDTADECGIHNPYHALNNLMGACDCLRKLINRFRGNRKKALAAYNAGPRAVDKYGGIPPYGETQAYVKRVLSVYRQLKNQSKKPLAIWSPLNSPATMSPP